MDPKYTTMYPFISDFMQKLSNHDIESILDNAAHRDMLIHCLLIVFRQSTWETDKLINEYLYCDQILKHPELLILRENAITEICSYCESFEQEFESLRDLNKSVLMGDLNKIKLRVTNIKYLVTNKMVKCPLFRIISSNKRQKTLIKCLLKLANSSNYLQ